MYATFFRSLRRTVACNPISIEGDGNDDNGLFQLKNFRLIPYYARAHESPKKDGANEKVPEQGAAGLERRPRARAHEFFSSDSSAADPSVASQQPTPNPSTQGVPTSSTSSSGSRSLEPGEIPDPMTSSPILGLSRPAGLDWSISPILSPPSNTRSEILNISRSSSPEIPPNASNNPLQPPRINPQTFTLSGNTPSSQPSQLNQNNFRTVDSLLNSNVPSASPSSSPPHGSNGNGTPRNELSFLEGTTPPVPSGNLNENNQSVAPPPSPPHQDQGNIEVQPIEPVVPGTILQQNPIPSPLVQSHVNLENHAIPRITSMQEIIQGLDPRYVARLDNPQEVERFNFMMRQVGEAVARYNLAEDPRESLHMCMIKTQTPPYAVFAGSDSPIYKSTAERSAMLNAFAEMKHKWIANHKFIEDLYDSLAREFERVKAERLAGNVPLDPEQDDFATTEGIQRWMSNWIDMRLEAQALTIREPVHEPLILNPTQSPFSPEPAHDPLSSSPDQSQLSPRSSSEQIASTSVRHPSSSRTFQEPFTSSPIQDHLNGGPSHVSTDSISRHGTGMPANTQEPIVPLANLSSSSSESSDFETCRRGEKRLASKSPEDQNSVKNVKQNQDEEQMEEKRGRGRPTSTTSKLSKVTGRDLEFLKLYAHSLARPHRTPPPAPNSHKASGVGVEFLSGKLFMLFKENRELAIEFVELLCTLDDKKVDWEGLFKSGRERTKAAWLELFDAFLPLPMNQAIIDLADYIAYALTISKRTEYSNKGFNMRKMEWCIHLLVIGSFKAKGLSSECPVKWTKSSKAFWNYIDAPDGLENFNTHMEWGIPEECGEGLTEGDIDDEWESFVDWVRTPGNFKIINWERDLDMMKKEPDFKKAWDKDDALRKHGETQGAVIREGGTPTWPSVIKKSERKVAKGGKGKKGAKPAKGSKKPVAQKGKSKSKGRRAPFKSIRKTTKKTTTEESSEEEQIVESPEANEDHPPSSEEEEVVIPKRRFLQFTTSDESSPTNEGENSELEDQPAAIVQDEGDSDKQGEVLSHIEDSPSKNYHVPFNMDEEEDEVDVEVDVIDDDKVYD